MGVLAALAASSMAFGGQVAAFGDDRSAGFTPALVPSEPRVPRPAGAKRPKVSTTTGRRIGRARDPFYGIKSQGRTGAREGAGEMAGAFKKTVIGKRNSLGRAVSNPFPMNRPGRNAAFFAALERGDTHNAALREARRIAA